MGIICVFTQNNGVRLARLPLSRDVEIHRHCARGCGSFMRRYLLEHVNGNCTCMDMAHCFCGVPCLSGTHNYTAEIKRWFFRKGPQTETDQKAKLDRLLGYMRRICDVRIEGSTKFDAPEMSAIVGKRPAKKPTFLLTLRRLLGKLFP